MPRYFLFASYVLAAFWLFGTLAAEPATAPATGTVEMRIIGPDGNTIANTPVHLSPDITTQTDDHGIARFPWRPGKFQIKVDVPGHGFGITGITAIVAGETVRAPLPPLVPYAMVTGTVPNGAGATIALDDEDNHYKPIAVADAAGRFTCPFRDGGWHLAALRDGKPFARPAHGIILRPGDRIDDLPFYPVRPKKPESAEFAPVPDNQPPAKPVNWAHGVVRDMARRPISGVTVYAVINFDDGHGSAQTALKTKTDADGKYAISGESDFGAGSLTVIAVEAGLPPAINGPHELLSAGDFLRNDRTTFPTASYDLVMAPTGGNLDVTVLDHGAPKPGELVQLKSDVCPVDDFVDPPGTAEDRELQGILNPSATTGNDGVAHFKTLLPGFYDVFAAKGVPVRAGETAVLRYALYDTTAPPVAFQIRRHDGRPLVGECQVRVRQATRDDSEWSPQVTCDSNGLAKCQLNSVGIWRTSFIYPIGPGCNMEDAPYYAAVADAGVSPRLNGNVPVRATGIRVNAANVSVQLLDPAGKPIRGFVKIGRVNDSAVMIASTDAQGRVVMGQVPSSFGNYVPIEAWAADPHLGDALMPDPAPLPPSDAGLTGHVYFASQELTTTPDGDVHLVMQAKPAGYVRGKVVPPPGHSTADYFVWPGDNGQTVNYQPTTGEFVAGPYPPGTESVSVGLTKYGSPQVQQSFTIAAGKVTALAPIHPPAGPQTQPDPYSWTPTPPDRFPIRILESDGKTPAYAATLRCLTANEPIYQDFDTNYNYVLGPADGSGIMEAEIWRAWLPLFGKPYSARLYLVAMQPGTTGAIVIDATDPKVKPSSITLPPPIAARGTLTLGGRPITGQTGMFWVYAAYQGKDNPQKLLDVSATPQADGGFELAGLTPGTYLIQASLDNIWVSDTVMIVAGDKALPDIHLDIPAPGGPAVIHCVSAKGKPLCGVRVVVDRPAGPLTELDWPAAFTTDGAGDAWNPALEAGKHTARLRDNPATVDFVVAPLPAAAAVEVKLVQQK